MKRIILAITVLALLLGASSTNALAYRSVQDTEKVVHVTKLAPAAALPTGWTWCPDCDGTRVLTDSYDNGWGGFPYCGESNYSDTFVLYNVYGTPYAMVYQCQREWNGSGYWYDWSAVYAFLP